MLVLCANGLVTCSVSSLMMTKITIIICIEQSIFGQYPLDIICVPEYPLLRIALRTKREREVTDKSGAFQISVNWVISGCAERAGISWALRIQHCSRVLAVRNSGTHVLPSNILHLSPQEADEGCGGGVM